VDAVSICREMAAVDDERRGLNLVGRIKSGSGGGLGRNDG
jgi:hypothetical protein